MKDVLFGDFETYSEVNLKKCGVDRYARDPSTGVFFLGYAFGDGLTALSGPEECPLDVVCHIENGGIFVAHNAPFELAIWNLVLVPRFGWPVLRPEQVVCTMARAYAMSLPGNLDGAAKALGLPFEKDTVGHQLMLRLCKPYKGKWLKDCETTFTFMKEKWTAARAIQRLGEYCKQDVEVERAIYKRARPLSSREQKIWLIDREVNDRGVQFNLDEVRGAAALRDRMIDEFDKEMYQVTDGAVAACSSIGALKTWAADYGILGDSLGKTEVLEAMDLDCLPKNVKRALWCRREAGRATSLAKLDAILMRCRPDGRVPDNIQYHGAATGRFAGRGIQPHNLPRDMPGPEAVDMIMELLREQNLPMLRMFYDSPMSTISQVLRGFMVAEPGKLLIGGDWSNVEGRGLAWLAGEEWKLDAFRAYDRGEGPDIYIAAYAKAFNCSYEDAVRQVGKVIELAFGYQGGVGAARAFGFQGTDEEADALKDGWRGAHPCIKQYWEDLEDAAMGAVMYPGQVFTAGAFGREVKYKKKGSFLWCLLPSQRLLCYPYPKIMPVKARWTDADDNPVYKRSLTYKSVPSQQEWMRKQVVEDRTNTRMWARVSTYGGKLSENVTQAICRDILTDAMIELHARGYEIMVHVHDEIVVEGAFTQEQFEEVTKIMNTPPLWAKDFPVAAACWIHNRYMKD